MEIIERLREGISFGPFAAPHHREILDARFREAFFAFVARQVLPRLAARWEIVSGRLGTKHDDARFGGPNSLVKHRYDFEGEFRGADDWDRVSFTVDFDPAAAEFRLPPGWVIRVETAAERRELDEELEREWRGTRLAREALRYLRRWGRKDFARAWELCARAWSSGRCVYGPGVGPSMTLLPEHRLCERFARAFPGSRDFLLGKLEETLADYFRGFWPEGGRAGA